MNPPYGIIPGACRTIKNKNTIQRNRTHMTPSADYFNEKKNSLFGFMDEKLNLRIKFIV